MTAGRLIAVVGPSGVGKDSVIAGLVAARPDIRRVRRAITRAPGLGGEDYDPLDQAEFDRAARAGAFCLCWSAHGLRYGIPADIPDRLRDGSDHIANLSRGVLAEAARIFPRLAVLRVSAAPGVLARRLAGRRRETGPDIAARLARPDPPLPPGLTAIDLPNDGPLADTVARALAALYPAPAPPCETRTT